MSADDRDSGEKPSASSDVALIHGVTPEGDLRILRKRHDRLELGGVRALREGMPITGEVVRLTPRPDFPLLCDVATVLPAPAPTNDVLGARAESRKGPAQVATDRYRDNWDHVFSRRPGTTLAN
jgi:hypothetical protein